MTGSGLQARSARPTDPSEESSKDQPATCRLAGQPHQHDHVAVIGDRITVDLGQTQDVSSVTLDLPESLDGTVYVADGPTNDEGELGSFSNESGEVTIDTDDAVQGRYVTVWFTSLAPDDDGRYRASLAEITVR